MQLSPLFTVSCPGCGAAPLGSAPLSRPQPTHRRCEWVPTRCARRTASGTPAASILDPARAALRLDVAAALLAFQPAFFRPHGRLGGAARDGTYGGFAEQFEQAVDGIGT